MQATDRPQAIGPVDVVLFTVKLYDVDASAATLAPLIGPDTVVITLQNGVDAMDMVAKHVGADHVAGGAAYIVIVVDRPGHLRHTGGQTWSSASATAAAPIAWSRSNKRGSGPGLARRRAASSRRSCGSSSCGSRRGAG